MALANREEMLFRSKHLTYFQQHGSIFAYHDLFGYIIGMSRDLVELLEFHHSDLRTREEVDAEFAGQFEDGQMDEFLQVLRLFSCVIDSELEEWKSLWRMTPVRTRWVVYHQPAPNRLRFWRTDRDGARTETAPAWAARLWAGIDNSKTLEELYQEVAGDPSLADDPDPRETVLQTLTGWVHHTCQYLKFSKAPVWKFGKEHQWPSYLRSTMPYRRWVPGSDPDPVDPLEAVGQPINPPHAYYAEAIDDAEAQFNDVETTLSHLFRNPHPLLFDRSYSQRVTSFLLKGGFANETTRHIVEVGAGMGHFAAGVLTTLKEERPELYAQVEYTIIDLSPALRAQQQKLLEERGLADKVSWKALNAEELELEPDSVDLLLCNEVIGDFTTVKLTRALLGLADEVETDKAFARWSPEDAAMLGDSGDLIAKYEMPLRDAPAEFYFNIGALQFLVRAAGFIRPGGAAFISEYGELTKYPVASTQLDHIEFSIQFGQLAHLARGLNLEADVKYVQDIIQLDREATTLETTRTYFASLRSMLAEFGITLDKIAYSCEMLEDLLGAKLKLKDIGDIRFRIVDERCMGLAPHEFKALLLRKPASQA